MLEQVDSNEALLALQTFGFSFASYGKGGRNTLKHCKQDKSFTLRYNKQHLNYTLGEFRKPLIFAHFTRRISLVICFIAMGVLLPLTGATPLTSHSHSRGLSAFSL